MKSMKALTMATMTACTLLIAGCDEKTQQNLKDKAAEAQSSATEMAKAGLDTAKETYESLKSEYAPQLEEMGAKVADLKEQASKFKDTQLDGYVSQLEAVIGDAKLKLNEAMSADGMTAIKDNMGKWMEEAKSLYGQATARIAELSKSASGG